MFHLLPVFIGIRYLRGRSGDRFGRFVSYMSTAGITIGVLSLITVLAVMNGFESQLKERILGVLPHAIVKSQVENEQLEENINNWQEVIATSPILTADAVVQSPISINVARLYGINPEYPEPISTYMVQGRIAELQDQSFKLVIGRKMAKALDIDLGDKVRVMVTSASQFTPIGRIPSQRNFVVAGIYDTSTDVDDEFIYANINDVARLIKKQNEKPDIRVFLHDPFDVPMLSERAGLTQIQWSDWRNLRGELFQAVKMEKNIMGLMLGLIILIAAFNIISALIMVVMEKQSEVAILKTQGMKSGSIVAIFVVQGASSGVIGAILGGIAGTLLSMNLNEIMQFLGISLFGDGIALPIAIDPNQVLTVVLGAIALSLLATLFPSIKAASVRPAEALRHE